eukprot:5457911-Amphidinium_carterae.1
MADLWAVLPGKRFPGPCSIGVVGVVGNHGALPSVNMLGVLTGVSASEAQKDQTLRKSPRSYQTPPPQTPKAII